MISRTLLAAGLALLTGKLVSAQTSSLCNPLDTTCPPLPAFGKSVTIDFTQGKSDLFTEEFGDLITYGPDGAIFTIKEQKQAPTLVMTSYIFYGKLEVVLKTAPGAGICTAVVLLGDDLGEIDWEWIGGQDVVQANYFPPRSNTAVTTYGRDSKHAVTGAGSSFHTYTIDWSPTTITLSIDGAVVRTINRADAPGDYPQTPMRVKLGTWNPGYEGNDPGTVAWAGGYTNFADGPFVAYYKSVTITDTGNGVSGATSYSYTDKSGTDSSIKIEGGSGTPNPSPSGSSSSSSAAGSSTTAAPSTLSTSTTAGGSAPAGTTDTPSTTGPGGAAITPSPSASTTAAPGTNGVARASASNFALLVAGAIFGAMLL